MKQSYQVTGMSCNGCRSFVEGALSKVEGVKTVTVDLEKSEAVLEMDTDIPFKKLSGALEGSHYQILPAKHSTPVVKKKPGR